MKHTLVITDLKPGIPLLLLLLTLLPLLAVGWLSARLHTNEKVVVEAQLRTLVDNQLAQIDARISQYFVGLEQQLLRQADQLSVAAGRTDNAIDRLRKLVRETPVIEQVFVLNGDGQQLFPPADNASVKEQAFVQKTQALWSDMGVFSVTEDDTPLSAAATVDQPRKTITRKLPSTSADFALLQSAPTRQQAQGAGGRRGWTIWYSGLNRELIFWFWNAQNYLTGVQLTTAYLTADLISRLPDGRSADALLGEARIQLLNPAQEVVYQWGRYDIIESETALNQRMLSHPLGGWQLAYYAPAASTERVLQWLLYGAALVVLALVLVLLAWIIYREYRRQTIIAQQRVSFVNQVSHELKTPLTNICLYADLLKAELDAGDSGADEPPPVVNKYMRVITAESQRLARLINNVLSFSRAQKLATDIQPRDGVIDHTIIDVAQVFEPLLMSRGIRIETRLRAPARVQFDAQVLQQILNNVLGNVEKYANGADRVELVTEQSADTTRITVHDNGPGIDPALADRVFEPFFRVSSRLTDGVAGTGIGLGIARELSRSHGGDLRLVDSEQGACFVIELATPGTQETQ